jgi:DNA-binding Xre family transcriptional regulator
MTGHTTWKDVRNRRTAAAAAEFEEGAAIQRARLQFAVTLRELRDRRDTRQGTLAERLHVSQANVSRIENEQDVKLSTLERYVNALGGRLAIHAIFDDADIVLIDAEDHSATPSPHKT